MTIGIAVRSALALILSVSVALLFLQHAGVPPQSALSKALSTQDTSSGPVLSGTDSVSGGQGPESTGKRPRVAVTPVVVRPSQVFDLFPNVQGHIIYTSPDHDLRFVTGHYRRHPLTGGGVSVAPALSPDGSRLAYVTLEPNASEIQVRQVRYGGNGEIIAGAPVQLTQDAAPPAALQRMASPPGYDPRYLWFAVKPSWMPDGQHLLYLSDRPGFDPANEVQTDMSVWEQGVTDTITNAVQLSMPSLGTGGADSPAWRPHDPQVYIFDDFYHGPELPGGQGIIKASMATTMTQPAADAMPLALTPHGATEFDPAWSPDGRYIAFAENMRGGRSNLMIMPFHRFSTTVDYDRHRIRIDYGNPYIVQPFWSPDGRYLGYLASTKVGSPFEMYIRKVSYGRTISFGPPTRIIQAGEVSAEYRPAWGP